MQPTSRISTVMELMKTVVASSLFIILFYLVMDLKLKQPEQLTEPFACMPKEGELAVARMRNGVLSCEIHEAYDMSHTTRGARNGNTKRTINS